VVLIRVKLRASSMVVLYLLQQKILFL